MKRSLWERHELMRSTENLRVADDTIKTGKSIIINLATQNETIRHSQSRLYDIGVGLGLSQTTMRTIQKHIRNDKAFVAGAICIIILFFIIFKEY